MPIPSLFLFSGKSKMAVLLWLSGLCTFYALSNVILGIFGTILLPLYFSFCGTEAAVRFSLLLCVHSVILACIPKQVVSKNVLSFKIFSKAIHSFIHSLIDPSFHQSVCLSHPSIPQSLYSFILQFIHSFITPSHSFITLSSTPHHSFIHP